METHDLGFISKKQRIDCSITKDIRNFESEGSSKVIQSASKTTKFVDNIVYKLYFKGLLSDVMAHNDGKKIWKAGFGVAICDEADNLLCEIKESVSDTDLNRKGVEILALTRGLNESINLGIRNILICCDDHQIYQLLTGRWKPSMSLSPLVEEVKHLREKMASSEPVLIARNGVKFAFKLARETIDSQISSSSSSSRRRIIDVNPIPKEICAICFEETDAEEMFCIDKCLHRYCNDCVRQHLEVKLVDGVVPKCLKYGCETELTFESCEKVLITKLKELWKQKMKEDSIPAAEKIYCPYPNCSMLMSKTELPSGSGSDQTNVRACIKCSGLFCIDCKAPSHSGLSCADYKKLNPKSEDDDMKLKSLAEDNGWRQCVKCNHYIDRFEGCNHVTCRCGYQFCYLCGLEWKKLSYCPSGCRSFGYGYYDDDDDDGGDDDDNYDSDFSVSDDSD
ncbi:E3 ubiquitin-protein ligase RSL1 [Cardamine amara subsp. amara]|uniref:RBR-type E3 ubiquitin transferase n=1 Tax=Cardamine amara subsp. amara TaxID=228776 RepID=A0ABD1AXM5_CARAN